MRYCVVKYFGHFRVTYHVDAENDKDAWENAERNGSLQYRSAYWEPVDVESKGYVKCLDDDYPNVIPREKYDEWMKEAIEKGMVVEPEEYERLFGLPFNTVFR